MTHIITHKISRGSAAHGREEIRALEDVGRTPGGIQYRTQTGAQAELPLSTSTDSLLTHDGTKPVWLILPTTTTTATAQPVDTFLHAVTASASQIIISWASVATQYNRFEIDLYGFQTATAASLGMRFSTDGTTVDTATNRNFWNIYWFVNVPGALATYDSDGATATNAASQSIMTPTDILMAASSMMTGRLLLWPDSMGNSIPPMAEWQMNYAATRFVAGTNITRVNGNSQYWGSVDIKGVALFPFFGAASFTDGIARLYGRV